MLDDLTTWITSREASRRGGGLAIVTGDPGSGRTSLLTALAESLAKHPGLFVATVADDGNRRSDALLPRAMIAALGGLPVGRSGRELIAEARALMRTHLDAGRRPVLLIDNAALSGSQLEIVRMLLPRTTTDSLDDLPLDALPDPLLVLFGPPELGDRIGRRRALAGMVERRHVLPPPDVAEIGALLGAPLDAPLAGTLGGRSRFTGEAIEIIAASSGGNLAGAIRIASACRREAIARKRTDVDGEIVREIVMHLRDAEASGMPDAAAGSGLAPTVAIQTRLDLGLSGTELVVATAPTTNGQATHADGRQ
ncbi:MAG: AAA family ATPase [Chloroflexia bacterium]|nr:AAA family ATPase [Chloroflexia bacterium]